MEIHCCILAWKIPMDRGDWQATVHEVTKSRIQLSNEAQHNTIFHCIYVSHLLYPFICQLTFRLLPCLEYCKQCFSDHWGAGIHVFLWVYAQEWNCWITQGLFLASYGTFIVFFICLFVVVLGLSCGMRDLHCDA